MNVLKRPLAVVLAAAVALSCLFGGETSVNAAEIPEDGETILVELPAYVPDMEIPENEELYAAYIDRLFYGGSSYALESGRTQLNPLGKQLYDYLKENFQRIAAGKSASTVFSITADQFAAWGATLKFASSTANQAFSSFMGQFEFSKVFNALLFDCPYELYWFDKVTGVKQSGKISGVSGNYSITSVKLSFAVVADLRTEGYSDDDPTFDTSNAVVASAAASNAKAIVDTYSDYSDYGKLKAYKEEICGLVSYDRAAASGGDYSTDADPWQLINVFDGDPSTNVVCEGYSKAFQYLCDLSLFSGDIACSTVAGNMTTGASTGGHMWNIVTIEGKNYMADVTNSDTGTSGYDGSLFLVGTPGDVNEGYLFNSIRYTYSSPTIALWGSGEDSILKLAEANYSPPSEEDPQPDPNVISQAEFEAALEAVGENGEYVLNKALTLTSDLTVGLGCTVRIVEGGSITVPNGVTLDFSGKVNGGQIFVEKGGTLTAQLMEMDSGRITVASGGQMLQKQPVSISGGSLTVQSGGSLSIQASVTLSVEPGGTLTVGKDAVLTAGQGGIAGRLLEGAVIEGIPEKSITLVSCPENGEDLASWAEAGTGYSRHDILLKKSFTLTGYTVIPGNTHVEMNASGGSADVVLTVPNGQSLTNMGTLVLNSGSELWIQSGGKLTDRGTISDKGGTLTLNGTRITDVTEDLKNVATNSAGMNRSAAAIRAEVQSMDTDALKAAMQDDRDGTGAAGSVARLENMAGGATQVVVMDKDCVFDAEKISVIGANLNTPVSESEGISLEVDLPSKNHDIPVEYDSAAAIQFSMSLKNVENPQNLEVPVKITLPIPQGILPESLVMLRFARDTGSAEELSSSVFAKNGQNYVSFVVTGFSDFAMTHIPEKILGDMNGDGQVTDADAVYLKQNLAAYPASGYADFDHDGKITDADAVYLLWHTLFPDRYPLVQSDG